MTDTVNVKPITNTLFTQVCAQLVLDDFNAERLARLSQTFGLGDTWEQMSGMFYTFLLWSIENDLVSEASMLEYISKQYGVQGSKKYDENLRNIQKALDAARKEHGPL